jgi:2-C-methyl-D-erythritol 4-phosphate cytidylyltransferase
VITKALVIPAAGTGSRMEKETPKPYLELSGKTILEHTIGRFLPLSGLRQVLVVTSEEYLQNAEQILDNLFPQEIEAVCLVGGKKRQDSIHNALGKVSEVDLVMIHDAVRPFVKFRHIEACCRIASEKGAAVLGVPAKDTIKYIDKQQLIVETPSRKFLWQTQTPQVFRKELILQAYKKARQDNFIGTDDASLVERLDKNVQMVEGDRSNFKITYPLDLDLAQLLIEKEQQ